MQPNKPIQADRVGGSGFMAWAASCDSAGAPIRSLDLHERWMGRLKCPGLKLNVEMQLENSVEEVVTYGVA